VENAKQIDKNALLYTCSRKSMPRAVSATTLGLESVSDCVRLAAPLLLRMACVLVLKHTLKQDARPAA